MDPSIMKLLEDDEDESLHSGADVEAFTAELNREVVGSGSAAPSAQLPDPAAGFLPQESGPKLNQIVGDWPGSVENAIVNHESQQQDPKHLHLKEQSSGSEMVFEGANNQSQHFNNQLGSDQPKARQEHSSSIYQQLQQAETSTSKFGDKEPSNSSQQSIVALKHDVNRPAEQQHMHQTKGQQAPGMSQTNSAMGMMQTPVITFHMLIPILSRHLDKDKDMQVQSIFAKLRKNEVKKEHFLRVVRNIVGDQMLRQAASQIQKQHAAQLQWNPSTNPNNYSLLNQMSSQQHVPSSSRPVHEQKPSSMAHAMPLKQLPDSAKSPHFGPASTVQMQTTTGHPASESNVPTSRESGIRTEMKGVHALQNRPSNIHAVSLQQMQQNSQHPQTSFSMYGTNNIPARPFPRPPGGPINSFRPQFPDSNPRAPLSQGAVPTIAGTVPTRPTLQTNQTPWQMSAKKEQRISSSTPTYLNQGIVNQHIESTQRAHTSFAPLHAKQVNPALGSSKDGALENRSSKVVASTSMAMTNSSQAHHPHGTPLDPNMQIPSAMQAPLAGAASKTPQKKPSVGQKKPSEALGSPTPLSSKKQKTSGGFIDQSIEQLNDVTAVSGVNLREEEEQLLSAPKEESRATEAARKVVQLEEEMMILQKGPLAKKLEEIMRKCSVKSVGIDVERCLSMCVEERLRGFISNLMRLSKQRVDLEKTRHQFYPLTSDVRSHILRMNREAKEEWDRKVAEEERLKKQNETEGNRVVDAEKEKNEARSNSKSAKAYKEEDDAMRTTAANAAARAAAGGHDPTLRWQGLVELRQQRSEGGDGSSSFLPGKALTHKPSLKSGKGSREHQETERRGHPAGLGPGGGVRRTPHLKVARSISIKDVISALEREPQMSRSSLVFRLHGRSPSDSAPK